MRSLGTIRFAVAQLLPIGSLKLRQTSMIHQPTTLYLVRHGSTPSNENKPRLLQGSGVNSGLSELGKRQARRVGEWFRNVPVDVVYSSPLMRAVETAHEICSTVGRSLTTVPELVEVDVGLWERQTWESIKIRYPDEYARFHADCSQHGYLGGESYSDVQRRVVPVFAKLLEQHAGQAIAVIAHSTVNTVYLATLLSLDVKLARKLPQENCAVNVIRDVGGLPQLMTLNSVFHLDAM